MRITASIGKTSWNTSLFPTSAGGGSSSGGKNGPYLIAIKAEVRRAEGLADGDKVNITCSLL